MRLIALSSILLLLSMDLAGQDRPAAQAPLILALAAQEPDLAEKGADGGILIRELVRQSILLAGREGLGLFTRDQALRETFPDPKGASGPPLEVQTLALPGKSLRIRLSRGQGANASLLWEKTLPLPPGPPGEGLDYLALIETCEKLSRTDFIEALQKVGFQGKANTSQARGKVSDALERRLSHLTFPEQLAAVQELHAAFHTDCESPARLRAMVRGYAHLGVLTEGLFNASPKVFKARALLYAERLAAAHPELATSRWTRAYARALSGFHAAALEILAKAAPEDPDRPEWVPWIEQYCRYDAPALAAAKADYHVGLVKFLSFLTVEGCRAPAYERSRVIEAIQANHDCYRLYDALCEIGGITNLHEATAAGPEVLGREIYSRLLEQKSLPESAKTQAESVQPGPGEPEARRSVWKALLAASEPAEPSWSLMGRLIEETSFVQAYRRGDFMKYKWSVPVDDFIKESAPLVQDHPYRALINAYALDPERQASEWAKAFEHVSLVDASDAFVPLINATWNFDPKGAFQGKKAWILVGVHRDRIAGDLQQALARAKDKGERRRLARELLGVSPHSPMAIATLIREDWGFASPKAAEWENSLSHHPQVMEALGNQYRAMKEGEKAERCLKKTIKLAPTQSAYRSLAAIYKEADRMALWKETLDAFLQTEDLGLDHANVRVEIARYYMDQKEYEKAAPYAEAAAQTWANWAMDCARDCYEGLKDWEKAELWQRRCSERYEGAASDWFLWCKRTGRGDVQEAERLAAKRVASLSPDGSPSDLETIGIFDLVGGRPEEAQKSFRKALEKTNSPFDGLHAALLSYQLKDVDGRDQALRQVAEHGEKFRPRGKPRTTEIEIAKAIRDALALEAPRKVDPAVFDKLFEGKETEIRSNDAYFVGRFLELQGMKKEAQRYYERAIKEGDPDLWNIVLAAIALREMK